MAPSAADEVRFDKNIEVREAAMVALGAPRFGLDVMHLASTALPLTPDSSSIALNTDQEWAEHLEMLFIRDAAKLSMPLSTGSDNSTQSEEDKDRIQYCQTRISAEAKNRGWVTDTFLARSVEYALRLQAQELSMRPIYWDDLGELRKAKIKSIVENAAFTAPQKLSEIKAVLGTFQEYIRTTGFRRDICDVSFTHPVCGTGENWVNSAGLAESLFPDLAQIMREIE